MADTANGNSHAEIPEIELIIKVSFHLSNHVFYIFVPSNQCSQKKFDFRDVRLLQHAIGPQNLKEGTRKIFALFRDLKQWPLNISLEQIFWLSCLGG